ncbi:MULTISPECIES: hypothetical protein [Pseudomonas]|nr:MULTISPECIES: hypothetical protein [Pseudomonas]
MELNRAFEVQAAGRRSIVFAMSKNQAIIDYADMRDLDESDIKAARASWADTFIEKGYVPPLELLKRDFYVECAYCSKRIDRPNAAVMTEIQAFCTKECCDKHQGVGDELEEASDIALMLWPDAHIVATELVAGRMRVHFTFGQPERHAFWFSDADDVQVAPVDLEDWREFNKRMKALRAQR